MHGPVLTLANAKVILLPKTLVRAFVISWHLNWSIFGANSLRRFSIFRCSFSLSLSLLFLRSSCTFWNTWRATAWLSLDYWVSGFCWFLTELYILVAISGSADFSGWNDLVILSCFTASYILLNADLNLKVLSFYWCSLCLIGASCSALKAYATMK